MVTPVEQSHVESDTTVLSVQNRLPNIPRHARTTRAALECRRDQFDVALHAFERRADTLAEIANALVGTLRGGGKVLVAGNGGSAAEAQHFAGELVGRFLIERRPYAAIALTADSSILTAVGNDYGFADVFARQVGGLGRDGDLLMLYSTSGESENLIRAAALAHCRGMTVAAVTGDRDSRLAHEADILLRVPATETPLIQELQMIVTHILCGIVEHDLACDEERFA
jgi:D-sedoheptulose 7-phosphate isomerase